MKNAVRKEKSMDQVKIVKMRIIERVKKLNGLKCTQSSISSCFQWQNSHP